MKHFLIVTLVTVVDALKMEAQNTVESPTTNQVACAFDFEQLVSSEDTQMIDVEVQTEEGNIDLTVDRNRSVHSSLAEELGCPPSGLKVTFADNAIREEDTFIDLGIEDGGKLSAMTKTKIPFQQFAREVADLNNLSKAGLMRNVRIDPNDISKVLGDVEWQNRGIAVLPCSIGGITVGGDFYLRSNLTSLPDEIADITVGGNLGLSHNRLISLPDRIGDITVGRLGLAYNRLTSLPDSIGRLAVSKLFLNNNQLTSLPDSIGNMTVDRLDLANNQITTLPDSLADWRDRGNIYLGGNFLS